MTALEPADGGYLIIAVGSDDPAVRKSAADIATTVRKAGWRLSLSVGDLTVWLGPASRLKAAQVHRQHILIGDWRWKDRALSSVIGSSRSPVELARGAVAGGWGAYILVWTGDDGRLAILRGPAGGPESIWWRRDGLTLVVHDPPAALDRFLPQSLAIDWTVLGEISGAIELVGDRLALSGLSAVGSGDLALIGERVETLPIWRPGDLYRPCDGWDETPDGMRRVVDETTSALASGHRRIFAEISGGLDSAIAAGSLVAAGQGGKALFANFYDDRPEGDEGRYAQAMAETLGVTLERIHKPVAAITREDLDPLGLGVRPGLHGLDVVYDGDVARRARAAGATGLLTGQGGDAVFFQAPDPFVVVDRAARLGLRALDPRALADVARWTRHSAWTIADVALRRRRPDEKAAGRRLHPWLEGLEGLPPAKAAQVRRIVNAQLFWGDCRRARAGELLHPFLSQPVVEHCLAIPADILTRGPRDRGLARDAFGDRLPSLIVERRDKGDLSHFYGKVVRSSAPLLKALLIDGRLAAHRLVDPVEVERGLTDECLIWDRTSNRFLILAVLEVWVRRWESRIDRMRRPHISIQPGDDAAMEVAQISGADI